MRDRYRLSGVGDDELLAALSALVRRENDLMSDLLAHLAELDERRLYLDLGFTSLFAYCTEVPVSVTINSQSATATTTPQGRPPMCTRLSTLPVARFTIDRSVEVPLAE
jgi:hypothetical protein